MDETRGPVVCAIYEGEFSPSSLTSMRCSAPLTWAWSAWDANSVLLHRAEDRKCIMGGKVNTHKALMLGAKGKIGSESFRRLKCTLWKQIGWLRRPNALSNPAWVWLSQMHQPSHAASQDIAGNYPAVSAPPYPVLSPIKRVKPPTMALYCFNMLVDLFL